MLKRVITPNMVNYVLGNYKSDQSVPYNENDTNFLENKKNRKTGRVAANDIAAIRKKVPKSKYIYEGLGHDVFYNRFEEVVTACAKTQDELQILLDEKDAVFTSKIPIYSTAFRPVSKTSETMFYPKINKWFSQIVAIQCKLKDMTLPIETIQALNFIQNYWIDATEWLITNEVSKKDGFVRSEIVGGTFQFSGRAVITLDISLNADEVDLPLPMCIVAFQYKITHILAVRYNFTLEQAYLYVKDYKIHPEVINILQEILDETQWIMILREPTNNLGSIEIAKIRRYKVNDDTISLPPEPLPGFNADFDGDQLNVMFLGSEKDGLVQHFDAFHFSFMTNFVNEKVSLPLLDWCDVCLGRMSE
jgi:DNA-directed RNA polymerase beta' subunit